MICVIYSSIILTSMSEYSAYMKQAKKEVESSLDIWKTIFEEEYSETIDYVYCKGSATKNWESYIDYVPVLSDVDIHVNPKEHSNFFMDDSFIFESINISEQYETRFIEENPNYFHLPRMQVINLKKLFNAVDTVIFPKKSEMRVLMGEPGEMNNPPNDEIKKIDLQRLTELEEFFQTIPHSMIDRTGQDLWCMIRRMNWRVSPSPFRLLSQTSENPLDLWALNRTKISEELEKNGYHLIAESYKDYYYEGWIAFMEDFTNSQSMRRIISSGYEVLKLCLEEARKLDT